MLFREDSKHKRRETRDDKVVGDDKAMRDDKATRDDEVTRDDEAMRDDEATRDDKTERDSNSVKRWGSQEGSLAHPVASTSLYILCL